MTTPCSIYIDLDDVLCETARALMYLAEREFGRRVEFEDIASFDIAVAFDLSLDEVEHTMRLMHEPDMLHSVTPLPHAGPVLEQWVAAGMTIEIVTGRPPSTAEVTRAWLQRHSIPFEELVFVNKYGREDPVPGTVPFLTLDELQQRPYHLAIDDSPEMAVFLARHMDADVILFNRPWNARAPVPVSASNRRVERCRGWKDIGERFKVGDSRVNRTALRNL